MELLYIAASVLLTVLIIRAGFAGAIGLTYCLEIVDVVRDSRIAAKAKEVRARYESQRR